MRAFAFVLLFLSALIALRLTTHGYPDAALVWLFVVLPGFVYYLVD